MNIIKCRPWLQVSAMAVLLSFVALNSGCFLVVAGAAGAGTVAFVEGKLTVSLGNDYESVVRAANRAVEQLQFVKVSENKDALSAVLTVRTSEDKKITIVATRVSDNLTKVEIRVGVFGDKAVSMTILDKIRGGL